MPAIYLSGTGAAGGIALITTAGGIGAFFAPTIVGWIASETGTLSYALIFYAALMAIGAIVMLAGTRPHVAEPAPVPAT